MSRKKIRTRAVLLILVWILLLALTLSSLSLLSILLERFADNSHVQSVLSLSWSGNVVATDFANPQQEVFEIRASWVVPKINASVGNGYSSAWIGIGGQFDKTLIQVGTEHDSLNGQAEYSAWYEILPENLVRTDMEIFEGDTINAAITLIDSATNEWNIQLTDATNGQTFSKNVFYNSTRLTGEWIVERPTINNQVSTLADFGSISFNNTYVKIGNAIGPISSFNYSQVCMTNHQSIHLTSVLPVSPDGSSFTVTYSKSS